MANVGALPAPPGVEPNFIDPLNQNLAHDILHAVGLSVVSVFFVIRLYTRYFIIRRLGWDDCEWKISLSKLAVLTLNGL